MKKEKPIREICIQESNWCTDCGRCNADEDLEAEAQSNHQQGAFKW